MKVIRFPAVEHSVIRQPNMKHIWLTDVIPINMSFPILRVSDNWSCTIVYATNEAIKVRVMYINLNYCLN